MSDRVSFEAWVYKGLDRWRVKVSAVSAAPNLALHRMIADPTRRDVWDLSQMSSGLLVGRFRERGDAEAFAAAAVLVVPVLGTDSDLDDSDLLRLGHLRKRHHGRRI